MNIWVPKRSSSPRASGISRGRACALSSWPSERGRREIQPGWVLSIFPPGCRMISKAKGLPRKPPGGCTYCVMSRCSGDGPCRMLAASVGCAIPADTSQCGYISEHHAYGQPEKLQAMALPRIWQPPCWPPAALGIDFDRRQSWDETRKSVKMTGEGADGTRNVTQSAVWAGERRVETVIAATVFAVWNSRSSHFG